MISKSFFFKPHIVFFFLPSTNPVFNFFYTYGAVQLKLLISSIKVTKFIWRELVLIKYWSNTSSFNLNPVPYLTATHKFSFFSKTTTNLYLTNWFLIRNNKIFIKNNTNVLNSLSSLKLKNLSFMLVQKKFIIIYNYYWQNICNKKYLFTLFYLLWIFNYNCKFTSYSLSSKEKSLQLSYSIKWCSISKLIQYNWKLV
jgi:hypothetical protein